MTVLSIETSCDETAVSVLDCRGSAQHPNFKILGNALYSQVKIHRKYGGVYPHLAKREHSKNLIPLLKICLKESRLLKLRSGANTLKAESQKLKAILEREPELLKQFLKFIPQIERPKIDAIAVTFGPGLEPALWVGINFAKALGVVWNLPVIPVNHMEGHVVSVLLSQTRKDKMEYPALALLISGGHTELVIAKPKLEYKIVGETRDDAVGEAYDKVARMLGLSYPGGPEISELAREMRERGAISRYILPRPMIDSTDLDFSFAGLKTAVLYTLKKERNLDVEVKKHMALAFEEAARDVLVKKTQRAIDKFKPKSLIVAGGVIANEELRAAFEKLAKANSIKILIPKKELSTDNSVMIGMAAYLHIRKKSKLLRERSSWRIRAVGNARLT